MLYKLDDNNKVAPCDVTEWILLYETKEGQQRRIVGHDVINGILVSTVFLGVNHSLSNKMPILFETMIFIKSEEDIYQERYCSWDDALKGHKEAIEWVKNNYKEES